MSASQWSEPNVAFETRVVHTLRLVNVTGHREREQHVSIAIELENLRKAFVPHPLDDTAAFAEWGGTYTDADRFRVGVRGRTWSELEAEFLERHHDALVFFGPASIAEYLPAYLSAVLRRDRELSAMPSFLFGVLSRDRDPERFEQRFADLAETQRQAIARALVALEAELEGSSRQQDVTEVLDGYWRSMIAGKRS